MSLFGAHSCSNCGGPLVPVGMTGDTGASQVLLDCKGCGLRQPTPTMGVSSGPAFGAEPAIIGTAGAPDNTPQSGLPLGVPFTSQRDLDMAEQAAAAQAAQHNYTGGIRNG